MNNSQRGKLRDELLAAGATKSELDNLVTIASSLGHLGGAVEPMTNKRHSVRLRLALTFGISSILGLAVLALLVITSQSVLPGSSLYPVQKASDNVAVLVDPSYRGTVMMRTADQVQKLVANHASYSRVMSALTDYQGQADSYKTTASNYEAFDYCKHSLSLAAATAPAPEKQAIDNALQSLEDV